ncbi:Manganese transport system membrane protein MntB [Planctomycetes bacterium Pla163]|uniref:Manganese transport system membrane protein MntB n=1 Tax=Rohdeia mirabilis TaxID=2528008 RepID=A0A518D006_9BACT|nr:Manganese transport system membrane protein MntB [Planctomycetes bacterium Pla163]
MSDFVTLDLVPLGTALGSGCLCALLGNVLVWRRATLLSDALSHSVLPGLVLGFVVAGALVPIALVLGGVVAGLSTAVTVAWLERAGRLETSAALAATLSTFFALGVVLIETLGLGNVNLSAEAVLTGTLPLLVWLPPEGGSLSAHFASLPTATRTVLGVAAVVVPTLWMTRKELIAASFDRAFAQVAGLRPGLLDLALYAAVAAAAVASFEALGSVLVVALFTCPPATARRLTRDVRSQVFASLAIAVLVVVSGYFAASFGPALFGLDFSLSPAGTIAVLAAVLLIAVDALVRGRERRASGAEHGGDDVDTAAPIGT